MDDGVQRPLLKLYKSILRPLLFRLPPETAHELSIHLLAASLSPTFFRRSVNARLLAEPVGPIKRFGLEFANPIGLAAGLDKNGLAANALSALGFGFVEIGSVTNFPQPGNPKPRLFRLPTDFGLINRAGFNNDGTAVVCERLARNRPPCVLGINIGKSKVVDLKEAEADYLASFELARGVADYLVINVSSPNTPNLRDLQRPEALSSLLRSLQAKNREVPSTSETKSSTPILVKLAPDLTDSELSEIVDILIDSRIAGIIATNTTVGRDGLNTPPKIVEAIGAGGLSGKPLKKISTEVIAKLFLLTRGRIPIIGVGGVFTPLDAWDKICAGASLIQLYTGMIYEGPLIVKRINTGLKTIFDASGFRTFDDAVGSKSEEYSISN